MRILHLIDAASPQAHSTTLAMLGDALGRLGDIEQRVYLLGGDHLQHAAEAAGLPGGLTGFHRVGAPLGRAFFAWPALRRALRRNQEADFDLIHCWSIGALTLATLMFRGTPKLLTLTSAPTSKQIHWLRMLTGEAHGVGFLPVSSTLRRSLIAGGVAEQAVHVLRPAIDMSRVQARSRTELREGWGVEDAKTIVIALLGDPPMAADAVAGVMINCFALETMQAEGFDVRLLVHPRQRRRLLAKRMLRDMGRLRMLIDEPAIAQPWSVLPGVDIALALGTQGAVRVRGAEAIAESSQRPIAPDIEHGYVGAGGSAEAGGGGLSLLWAMAANIPIIGEATYAVSEIVEDRHTALLARPGLFRAIAHRLCQIVTDKQLAWQLRDTARHECYSFFSRLRYCDSLRAVYTQLHEGRPIDVPVMESTGGLRFSGRG